MFRQALKAASPLEDNITHIIVENKTLAKNKLLQLLFCQELPDRVHVMPCTWLEDIFRDNEYKDESVYQLFHVTIDATSNNGCISNKRSRSPEAEFDLLTKIDDTSEASSKKICPMLPSADLIKNIPINIETSILYATSQVSSKLPVGTWNLLKNDMDQTVGLIKLHCQPLPQTVAGVIGFDLDGTLIVTQSGKRFPIDGNDWKLFSPSIPTILRQFHEEGHHLMILSNQAGISIGHSTLSDLQQKIDSIITALDIPIDFICAFEKDLFRKPRTAAWEFLFSQRRMMNEDFQKALSPSTASSLFPCIYVGDAAGRPKQGNRPKDHSAVDYKLALNLGIEFRTPEEFFLQSNQKLHTDRSIADLGFHFNSLASPTTSNSPSLFTELCGSPEILLLIGPPASGKSTLCLTKLTRHSRINQDLLKSRKKCLQVAKECLSAGKSVVVDSTNGAKESRRDWVALATELNLPIRALMIKVSKEICMHLAVFRELDPSTLPVDRRSIPPVVIHTYFKNFQPVTAAEEEGFTRVDEISFIPEYPKDNISAKILFSYLI